MWPQAFGCTVCTAFAPWALLWRLTEVGVVHPQMPGPWSYWTLLCLTLMSYQTPLHETVSEMHSSCWGATPWHRPSSLWAEDGVAPRNTYWANALLWKQIFMGVDCRWQDNSYTQSGIPCQKQSTTSPTLANPSWHFIVPCAMPCYGRSLLFS